LGDHVLEAACSSAGTGIPAVRRICLERRAAASSDRRSRIAMVSDTREPESTMASAAFRMTAIGSLEESAMSATRAMRSAGSAGPRRARMASRSSGWAMRTDLRATRDVAGASAAAARTRPLVARGEISRPGWRWSSIRAAERG
jgi:hypothetical protein